jgi:hypothetical protein
LNQAHLLHALGEFESIYNQHRPCTAQLPFGRSANRSPNQTGSTTSTSVDATDSAASSTSTHTRPDQLGRNNRHPQDIAASLTRAAPEPGPEDVKTARPLGS